eukprot:scaffold148578_cov56-Attheya_sp.AAC.1
MTPKLPAGRPCTAFYACYKHHYCSLRLDAPKDATRENGGPGLRGTEPELLGAGNGRQAPITMKVAFLGSMLGPSALFNT